MKKLLLSLAALFLAAVTISAQDPIDATCAEAAAAMPAQHNDETQDVYIVTGYVTNTNGSISPSRTDPSIDQQTFWMDDVKGSTKTLQGYWCNLPGHEALNVGDKITVTGKIMNYNNTPEIKNGDVAIIERTSVDTIEVTVAEAVEVAMALERGAKTDDRYAVTGFVSEIETEYSAQYHNISFYMSDNINNPNHDFLAYRVSIEEADADKVVVGAKVKVTANLQRYYKAATDTDPERDIAETVSGGVIEFLSSSSAIPSDADLAPYATKTYTMCIYNESACNDIVLIGSYVGWSTSAELEKFQAVEGFEGWYVATWDDETDPTADGGIQAKPVQLDGSGLFNWDYQLGADAELIRGTADLLPGNTNEVDIKNIGAGIVVIDVKSWKNNPCTAVYHVYNVALVSPDCNDEDYVVPAISGGFNGWEQQAMEMNELKTAERQQAGLPGAVFEVSFRAAEGTEFKFRSSAEWGSDWSNLLREYNAEEDAWMAYNRGYNIVIGEETDLFFDLGDPELYSWDNCKKPELCDEDTKHMVVVGINPPAGVPEAGIEIIGTFDGWTGTAMERIEETGWYIAILEDIVECDQFKFREAGSWENEIVNAESGEGLDVIKFKDVWSDDTYKGDPCKWIELDYSYGYAWKANWSDPAATYNVNLSGFTYGYINNYGTIYGDWSGTLPANTNIYLECYPSCGSFERWSDGVTSSYRSITLTQDTTISAIISGNEVYHVSITGGEHGYLYNGYVGDRRACDGSLYVEAYPYDGYRFTQWSDGVTDNPRIIEFTQDTTIVAEYVQYIYRNVKIGDLYYTLNVDNKTASVVGTDRKVATVSVKDNSIAEWDNLPQEYVAEATCPADAAMLGLKSVKVYADTMYINILVEPNMDDIVDFDWVPFHVYLNADNSNTTGGYGDLFTDANTDILCETALFCCGGELYNYNPAVYKWWGEVGADGWEWTDPSVEHDASDFWGAIIGEGQLPVGASEYVDGKFEIQLLRDLLATAHPMNDTEFGIGVEIQQNWSAVGVLPCASVTDENPRGKAAKLKVKINKNGVPQETIKPELVIPSSVSYEGEVFDVITIISGAFANHTELTHVEIPTSMTYIDYQAFVGCDNITSVVWNAKDCNSYNFGTQVESFVFGDQVEYIPDQLCRRMSKLTSINIPNSVMYIGNMAFEYCNGLTSIEISNNEISAGYDVFYGCENLVFYQGPAVLCRGMYYLQKAIVTGGTIDFNYGGIRYSERLTYLDIAACDNTILPMYAFNGNYSLKQLILPKHLESIEYMALAECMNLEEITIPAAVATIENRAFEDCRSLKSVTFAGSALTTIGDWAFYNCHELKNLVIPEGVTIIGKAAFYGCAYLNEVTLPASVQALGDNAFALCSMMKRLNVNAVVPPTIEDKTFEQVSLDMPVYVPEESVQAYKADQYWGRMNIIGAETAVENISSGATSIRKQMINGQLFILRGDKIYTVQGQVVK